MGQMIEGVWHSDEDLAHAKDGHFARPPTRFRGTIERGGPHPPEAGRYHLYVSLACHWAHRALIVLRLKGLDEMIGLSVTHWLMRQDGWTFAPGPGVVPDPLGAAFLHEIYRRADPLYSGRVTVPILWDKQARTIVNNESSEIIRIFGSAFDAAVVPLFATLDWLDEKLSRQPYLSGGSPTEADWRLFTTLVRFDAVYHGHFKCNFRRLVDYAALWDYARRLYQWSGVRQTVDFDHIKGHYYGSHRNINPTGIVPLGPVMDWEEQTVASMGD